MGWGRAALAVLAALWLVASAALAFDEALLGKAEKSIDEFRAGLDRIALEIKSPALNDAQLADQRTALEAIRTGAADQSAALGGPITEVDQQIASLGKADPEKEPPAIAAERAKLQASRDRLLSAKSRLDVISIEAEQMAGRVAAQQRDNFFQRIFQAERSILDPSLWADTAIGVGVLFSRLFGLFGSWWTAVAGSARLGGLLLFPALLTIFVILYRNGRHWLRHWTGTALGANRSPDDLSRLWHVVWGQVRAILLIASIFAAAYLTLKVSKIDTARFVMVFDAVATFIAGTTIYYLLARRVAAPGQPQWRIIDVDESTAARLPLLVGLIAFFSVGNENLVALANGLFMPVTYTIGHSAHSALVMLVLTGLVVWTLRHQPGLESRTPGRRFYFGWSHIFTAPVWLLIVIGLGALLLGYLSLASYIATQLFQTGLLVVTLFLLHHLSDAAVAASFDPQSGFGRFLRRVTGLGERAMERLGLLFRTAVDMLLVVIGLPMLLILWTVTWVDLRSLVNSAMIGVQVGNVTLSPGSLLVVLAILVIGVLLTNLIIRWLDRRILSEVRVDKGVQDSVRKGASYAGYIVAAALALSAAGFEFSNIAIIAGALGVGIGFGLQSIVNNFISGLILLAERPIRVGDWVSLDSGEGLVKRINVRATEIETFDSCSIIVPNLSLITGVVKNWTHDDTIGRLTVAIIVDHDSDPAAVRDILLEIARAHPKVLTFPEPGVVLGKISQIGLEFELKATVADVFEAGLVASDLRFTLLERLREKGITIARPLAVFEAPKK